MHMDKALRNILYNTSVRCRELLEHDLALQLEGTYGVHTDGTIEPLEGLKHLDAVGRADRQAIEAALHHEEAGGAGRKEAVERFLRESAFTMLNRLAALKLMEHPSRGLIQPSVGAGPQSKGFQQLGLISPEAVRNEPDPSTGLGTGGGYRLYLELLFDDLAHALGPLFDRTLPASILFPSQSCLNQVLALLNDEALDPAWPEDETIGWIYQYFTPAALRDEARKASNAPRNSYELGFRNQFYTPRYVVAFLVDNTLGRLWYEMRGGKTRLVEQCRYLIRRPIEVFLDPPDQFLPRECRDWVRQVRSGDFSHLPDEPTELELASISLAFNGYDVAENLGGYGDLLAWAWEKLQAFEETGELPPSSLDRWLMMFALQRYLRDSIGTELIDEEALELWRQVYFSWREALQAETSGSSGDGSVKRPAYIAHRPPTDPRELRILDPACGSGHFLLYAFDLLITVYEEAWQSGWMPEDEFGTRGHPILLHDTVRATPISQPISNYASERVAFEDAYIVITNQGDFGDGVEAHQPYLVSSTKRFRVPFDYRVRLAEFDYSAALESGLFDEAAGERLVRKTAAFTFDELPPLGSEEGAARFRRQIPRLILTHNLHGIDIDARACQIARLALWLRAQRAWAGMGVRMRDRPTTGEIHVVCAEPMPGEYDLLGEFVRDLKPAVLGNMLRDVWDKMKLAGEAGSLLKIEQEVGESVRRAREALASLLPGYQMTLFGPEPPQQLALRLDPRDLHDTAFWDDAEARVVEALRSYARRAIVEQQVSRHLFALDALQGMAFIDMLQRPFDVVLMNPPFGAASVGSKAYIQKTYPRTKNDLYAAFVERGLELLRPGGYLGAITSRTGFFLTSFQKWREEIMLREAQLIALADLGYGVLDTAMVETAAYVVEKVN